jgi:predicted GTPase
MKEQVAGQAPHDAAGDVSAARGATIAAEGDTAPHDDSTAAGTTAKRLRPSGSACGFACAPRRREAEGTEWHGRCTWSGTLGQEEVVAMEVNRTLDCIVMGAAGRDFHVFLTFFRDHPEFRVRCFTAHQIPFIDERQFPASLAPPGYEDDIPIYPEARLEELVARYDVDFVFLAYSDLSHAEVMHRASRVQATGASFVLLGPHHTQIHGRLPVLSVTAVRTGCGKSPVSRLLAVHLRERGLRVAVVRHPMPYGDLAAQRVQRFAESTDLDRHGCTIEEREEYEPYLELGLVIYAGVDYRAILEVAEAEADIVLWDGGNNDLSFYRPDLSIVLVDALRPGHESAYYPGETNLRLADVVVITKVDQASVEALAEVRRNVAALAPRARVVEGALDVEVRDPGQIAGRRAIVVEDGPTITHGGMPSGAALVAARRHGAEVVDPRPHAVGSLARAYAEHPHIGPVLPALGYAAHQRRELAETIAASGADLVIDGSPARLDRVLSIAVPVVRVDYHFVERSEGIDEGSERPSLIALVDDWLDANLAR